MTTRARGRFPVATVLACMMLAAVSCRAESPEGERLAARLRTTAERATKPGKDEAMESIVLGGGCFWCVEAAFQIVDGVTDVEVGYAGGTVANPTYQQVCSGDTGHAEVARVVYDPDLVSLEALLEVFLVVHDPTSLNRQGADVGTQYRSAVFYETEDQQRRVRAALEKAQPAFSTPLVTQVAPLDVFFKAEIAHQDYYRQNPDAGYCQMVIAPKIRKLEGLLQRQ